MCLPQCLEWRRRPCRLQTICFVDVLLVKPCTTSAFHIYVSKWVQFGIFDLILILPCIYVSSLSSFVFLKAVFAMPILFSRSWSVLPRECKLRTTVWLNTPPDNTGPHRTSYESPEASTMIVNSCSVSARPLQNIKKLIKHKKDMTSTDYYLHYNDKSWHVTFSLQPYVHSKPISLTSSAGRDPGARTRPLWASRTGHTWCDTSWGDITCAISTISV